MFPPLVLAKPLPETGFETDEIVPETNIEAGEFVPDMEPKPDEEQLQTITAFAASTASSVSVGTIIYEDDEINEGNMYNKYTGMFTAPTSGIYQISTLHASPDTAIVKTVVNGDTTMTCEISSGSCGATKNVRLSAGDAVWNNLEVGTLDCDAERNCGFSGHLLFESGTFSVDEAGDESEK